MGWFTFILKTTAKCLVPPPVAIAMDLGEAAISAATGNFVNAGACLVSATISIVPGARGAAGIAKGGIITHAAAKEGMKKAAEKVTVVTVKEIAKQCGKEAGKQIAMKEVSKATAVEMSKRAAVLFAADAMKEATKEAAKGAVKEGVKKQVAAQLIKNVVKAAL